MYSGIKSCVIDSHNNASDYFESHVGVRQGECLSPLLFSLFLNDIESFFMKHDVVGVTVKERPIAEEFLRLLVLLYADDTILLSNTAKGLQDALQSLELYCNTWKLKVNSSKTKVMVCSTKRKEINYKFMYDNTQLEIVKSYKYLGVLFVDNGSFSTCKTQLKKQAERAMFCLLRKCRKLDLTVDLQLELFDKIVTPILLYGCEIWGTKI